MDQYPRSKRPIEERARLTTDEHRAIGRQFGKEFFDGDRLYGYGGYNYHPRFWQATVKPFLQVGNARELPYEDNSFDPMISITTIHNLPLEECKQALREIQRVSRKHAFITVDAWRTEEERERMEKWNLTALTYKHVDDWKKLFAEVGYTGDCYWFIAE